MLSQRTISKSIFAIVLALALPLFALAQSQVNFTINGTITGANGEPLIGAAVQLKESRLGTITDLEGKYVLSGSIAEGEYTLETSYIGYANNMQKVTVKAGTTTIDIALSQDALFLDEQVVIGSTINASRRQLGNAINTVDASSLEKTGTNNLVTALQGKVAGAQITQTSGDPAGGISVKLRGVNSIRGDSDPLYVIDGVIVSNFTSNVSQVSVDAGVASLGTNRMADINPQDIETINIINGAAAAAIYGSRAANGVVLITTKRGKTAKPVITFNTSVSINELRKKVPISTYGKQFGTAALRLYTIGAYSGPEFFTLNRTNQGVAPLKLASNLVDVTRYDYQDQVFHRAMGTDNSLSVAGGSEKTHYYASLSYTKNDGIVRNTDFQRYALRLNLDQTLTSWAKIAFGLSYNNSFSNERPNGNSFFSPINSINITNNIYDITQRDANGNLQAVEPTRVNPLSVIEDFKITQEVNRAIGNINLTLYPFKGLKVDYIVGADVYSQAGNTFIPPYPYAGVNPLYYNLGYASTVTSNFRLFNNDLNINYDVKIGSKFQSTTTAGFNYQYLRNDRLTTSGQQILPSISTIAGASAITAGYALGQSSTHGYFLQETFGYANQVFLTLAGRVDGSSRFASEKTNQTYLKAGLSWVVSDNEFWKNAFGNVWNGLKLRASLGESGGLTAIGDYDRFWQFSPVNYLGKLTFLPSTQLANPLISPERTRELEFGGDFGFFNNRINLRATYYTQDITDLVVNRILAATTGGRSIVDNVGKMENKGFEINLGINPINKKDFSWDMNFIYSNNKNKIISAGSSSVGISNSTGAPAFLVEGQAASVFYGTYYAAGADGQLLLDAQGLPQPERGTAVNYKPGEAVPAGSYLLGGIVYTPKRDANGQPTGTALRRIIGNPNPKFLASFINSITYKKLTFSFLLDGVFGVDVFNADKRTRQGVGIGDFAEKELKGELPRGYIASIYPIEQWRVDNGSFVKVREISLSYRLGKVIKGISDLNVSLVGRNLFSFDKYNGYDPETNAGGNSDLLRGVDFGNVPIPRTYQLSVTAKF